MAVGPLAYVVIGVSDYTLSPGLYADIERIQRTGVLRVTDMIYVTKAADGRVVREEVNRLSRAGAIEQGDISNTLMGLVTTQDIKKLIAQIPSNTSALIILFEHTWVIELTEAIRENGELVIDGGMISHGIFHVNAQLREPREGPM